MKKLNKILAILLALIMLLSVAAFADEGEAEDEDYKVFRYGAEINCKTFNPYTDLTNNSAIAMEKLVCERLWNADEDGNVIPVLASYEYNEDYTVFTVHCKEGIVYSNGNPFTADDVLAAFWGFRENGRTANLIESLDLDNAVLLDDYTLEVPLFYYDAGFVYYFCIPYYFILDAETHAEDPEFSWLIGTGPYYLDTWEESVKYVLKRNPNWRGEPGYYDEIDIFFYEQEATRYAEFQAGNLDAVYLTDASYINNLKNGELPGTFVYTCEGLGLRGLSLSINEDTTQAFADINLRKALAHCIDTRSIVETLGEGTYLVPESLFTSGCWAYIEGTGVYEYDPEYAVECMTAAGYGPDNPVTIHVYCENSAWNSALIEAVQFYASQIGFDLDLTGVAPQSTILPILIENKHDLGINSTSSGAGLDPECQLYQATSTAHNRQNGVAPGSELDEILRKANSSHDQEERKELYQQFAQMYHDDYIFIPMYVNTLNYAYNENIDFESCIDVLGNPDFYLLGE